VRGARSAGWLGTLSLRVRLIALVALVFLLSLALGGTVACLNASLSVEREMRAAMTVARQTVEAGIADLGRARDPERELERLVGSFRGNRHVRVAFAGAESMVATPTPDAAPLDRMPGWFVRLMAVPPSRAVLPVDAGGRHYGEITIETVPHNELLEVWNEFGNGVLVLALFSVPTLLLIYLFIGHALRPLGRLAGGLARVGGGDYAVRLDGPLPPELSRLRDSFNRMTAQLAGMSTENRRLNEQLLTLQEQERSDLARDLHDEIGPFLFAINIDAAAIRRQAEAGRQAKIAADAAGIGEAVGHLQRQVKRMLGRLRPIGLAEFGLAAAIEHLVEFWRRRHADVAFRVSVSPEAESRGELIDTTVYRVIQECLSNALRHGRPGMIEIRVASERDAGGDAIVVTVRDDGGGMAGEFGLGYGLLGMGERVRAMGGALSVANDPGAGLAVTARLPLAAPVSA